MNNLEYAMKKRQDKIIDRILDVIIYSSILIVLIWALLKGFGMINTPAIVQQIPFILGAIGIGTFVFKMGRFVERIEQRLANHDIRFAHIDKDLEFVKQDLHAMKQSI